jgi:hypothetical protein
VAAHVLEQAGFAVDDAQAIGIDGAKGMALDYRAQVPPMLHPEDGDTRRFSDLPGQMQ